MSDNYGVGKLSKDSQQIAEISNDRIAEKIEPAELCPDEEGVLEKLLGNDYEVITADDRLDKVADDFVKHCATRWEAGKSMLVCIDKVTCARVYKRIMPRWKAKAAVVRQTAEVKQAVLAATADPDARERLHAEVENLRVLLRAFQRHVRAVHLGQGLS